MSALSLMEAFQARGVASCVVSHTLGGELNERLRDVTRGQLAHTRLYWWNRLTRVPGWKRPLSEAKQAVLTGRGRLSAAKVARWARQWNADLIHTCTVMTPEGAHAARWLQLPHVWHVRELIGPGRPFRLPIEGPALGSFFARNASVVVANSEASAACLSPWLPPGLMETVPNGIDLSAFTPRTGATAGRCVVAMVGSLDLKVKNHALFLDAANSAVAPTATFQILGGAPAPGADAHADALRQRRSFQALGPRLELPPRFQQAAQAFADLDVLVQPTRGESFGRVTVEAMAAGVPVIAVEDGGSKEIVVHEETGLFVPPDDPPAMARAIERLAADPALRERLGRAGRERALRRFSLEACANRIAEVYAKALERPLRRGF